MPGTITTSTAARPIVAPTHRRATKKVASRTWWKVFRLHRQIRHQRDCRSPVPRSASNQTRADLRRNRQPVISCAAHSSLLPVSPGNFITGRGTPYGLLAVPVIKMATRTALANRWHDLMDIIDAGTIATGDGHDREDVGWQLFHFILISPVFAGKPGPISGGLHKCTAAFNPALGSNLIDFLRRPESLSGLRIALI